MAGQAAAVRWLVLLVLASSAAARLNAPKTLLISPVASGTTATAIEGSSKQWLTSQCSNGAVKVTHLRAVHIVLVNGIPSACADGLLAHLRVEFPEEEGKPRNFEWDGTVGIASGSSVSTSVV
mmetsp:Transcript_149077/g.460396  ORF Transcript_149077/g.460396 Transcript_149077/m.460396 type:complete len:123 (-) Transcript_149077:114-482(-)|eukprot:CAMPEP_0204563962 /NCGR_PEP_ID=MMETSP0661-20131031/34614_1 /ASSEMBLY_ACC=CAM_ASM_000606 /TAXON_ID=109239 /ORGANISM="Alexandrium margalefi, Strain AMGDE01CS-322" /LENGTH=122 /DNA_ID=CAMNT_0051571565 /DNA_START=68 /DNA_END=436 /DNA_ORIENTATION=-